MDRVTQSTLNSAFNRLADAESYTGAVIAVIAALLLVVAAIAGVVEARVVPRLLIPVIIGIIPGLLLSIIGIAIAVIAHIAEEGQAAVAVDQATAITVTHAVYESFSCKQAGQELNAGANDVSVEGPEPITHIGHRSTTTVIAVVAHFAVAVIIVYGAVDMTVIDTTVAEATALTIVIVFPIIAILLAEILHLAGPAISPGLRLEGRLVSHIAIATIAYPVAVAATYIEVFDMTNVNYTVAVLNTNIVGGAPILKTLIDTAVGHIHHRRNIVPVNGKIVSIAFVALTACFPSHSGRFSNCLRYPVR